MVSHVSFTEEHLGIALGIEIFYPIGILSLQKNYQKLQENFPT